MRGKNPFGTQTNTWYKEGLTQHKISSISILEETFSILEETFTLSISTYFLALYEARFSKIKCHLLCLQNMFLRPVLLPDAMRLKVLERNAHLEMQTWIQIPAQRLCPFAISDILSSSCLTYKIKITLTLWRSCEPASIRIGPERDLQIVITSQSQSFSHWFTHFNKLFCH